jgi:3-deoxy-manno-octulosonate cytidylyltransferase (CMP-KDO synthetase)
VLVATDDERIAAAASDPRAPGSFARRDDPRPITISGTDRIAEVAQTRAWDGRTIVVNVQGDEPQLPPQLIDQVASLLERHGDADLATLCTPIGSVHEFLDPNVVKVVTGRGCVALYFSRAPIPWHRDGAVHGLASQTSILGAQRHLGIYAYRVEALRMLTSMPPSDLEVTEKLEQLRALQAGMRIVVGSQRSRRPRASTLKLTWRASAPRWTRARNSSRRGFFQLGVMRGFQHVAVPTDQQIAVVHHFDDGSLGNCGRRGARTRSPSAKPCSGLFILVIPRRLIRRACNSAACFTQVRNGAPIGIYL